MRKIPVAICILTLAILACSIHVDLTPASQSQSAIATIVVQTMQAVANASSTPIAVFATPVLTTPSPSATPMAVIKAITYCRTGPGENYESIADVNPNQEAAVIGKDSAGDYWLIVSPIGDCWVAAKYVAITGDIQNIPESTSPPPAASGVPARPGSLIYSYFCPSLSQVEITLSWTDVADNESGYRVYRKGTSIAELRANSTTYVDSTSRSPGSIFSYSVEAFNSIGASNQRTTGNFSLSRCTNP